MQAQATSTAGSTCGAMCSRTTAARSARIRPTLSASASSRTWMATAPPALPTTATSRSGNDRPYHRPPERVHRLDLRLDFGRIHPRVLRAVQPQCVLALAEFAVGIPHVLGKRLRNEVESRGPARKRAGSPVAPRPPHPPPAPE